MAAATELTPTSYIQHHLTFLTTASESGTKIVTRGNEYE